MGYIHDDEFRAEISDIKKALSELPDGDDLVKRLRNIKKQKWTIDRRGHTETIDAVEEDALMLGGAYAREICSQEELADFEAFGFSSFTQLAGTIGVIMKQRLCTGLEKGYSWIQRHPNGRKYRTLVTADMHGDFEIHQRDITPYRTLNPLGEEVTYRPVTREDSQRVCASYSVEPGFLTSLLRFATQHNMQLPVLEDGEFLAAASR